MRKQQRNEAEVTVVLKHDLGSFPKAGRILISGGFFGYFFPQKK
jgi:hypothetical protein